MIQPPRWTEHELDADRLAARDLFRKQRIEEPAETYSDAFEEAYQAIAALLEATVDLANLRDALPDILDDANLRRALRYIAGPPISEDDLKTVAEVGLTKRYLRANPAAYDVIAQSIYMILDRKRFPWAAEGREPDEAEKAVALVATAVADAYQAVQARRRNAARSVEGAVADVLDLAGFTNVAKRRVTSAGDWPKPGEFCGEQKVAGRQADLIVTLFDSRYMPIECKVSGSAINSIKRLNNDSMAKFEVWTRGFGVGQTIPVAVLEGVYASERLVTAQNAGATIFWSHKLEELASFVNAAR